MRSVHLIAREALGVVHIEQADAHHHRADRGEALWILRLRCGFREERAVEDVTSDARPYCARELRVRPVFRKDTHPVAELAQTQYSDRTAAIRIVLQTKQ